MSYINTDAFLRVVKIVIPAAQVLTMGTVPVELLPAPAPGKILTVYGVYANMEFNTTAYTTANTIPVTISGTSQPFVSGNSYLIQTFLTSGADILKAGSSNNILITSTDSIVAYTSISGIATDPTLGDSDITIYVSYSETEA